MKLQWLPGPQAVDLLNPIIERRNRENPNAAPWALMNDQTSFAVAAMEDEFVIGFLAHQFFPFLGPFWLEPSMQNTGIAKQLVDSMVTELAQMNSRALMVVAESPVTVRMCESRGMKKLEFPVYYSTGVVE